ncbi:hypothetical protein BT63DRAFT_424084 [Microthyrium microscopicum]|uniref:F-box domain-containing protein n=1 Tax=Microthyrium microscopicum TaxID=703497 RepID=A0A6A6UCX2_9PEZI|nr:hypothetical protein BT63DRAFT_424084 [Microthyrium microscopicum]
MDPPDAPRRRTGPSRSPARSRSRSPRRRDTGAIRTRSEDRDSRREQGRRRDRFERFFELPSEIRNRIYEYLVVQWPDSVAWLTLCSPQHDSDGRYVIIEVGLPVLGYGRNLADVGAFEWPGIFHANRQLAEESKYIFYTKNRFSFGETVNRYFGFFNLRGRRVDPYHISIIRHIEDNWISRRGRDPNMLLRTFPSLLTLQTRLPWSIEQMLSGLHAQALSTTPALRNLSVYQARSPPLKSLTCIVQNSGEYEADMPNSDYANWFQPEEVIKYWDDIFANNPAARRATFERGIAPAELVEARHLPDNFNLHRQKMNFLADKMRRSGLFDNVQMSWEFTTTTFERRTPRVTIVLTIGKHSTSIICQVVGDFGNSLHVEDLQLTEDGGILV